MENGLYDFLIEIIQNLNEIESLLKVLRDSVNNENNRISLNDIENTLETIIARLNSTKISLDKLTE